MKNKCDYIVRVWGGIGNQLFIYSFARVLELQTNKIVRLEKRTGFMSDGYNRSYKLNLFYIKLKPVPLFYTFYFFTHKHFPYLCRFIFLNCSLFVEKPHNSTIAINQIVTEDKCNTLYLQGYWQNFNFKDYRQVLLGELRFKLKSNNKFDYYCNLIESKIAVAIHIRRIQYSSILELDYYLKAIEIINKKYLSVTFFIFSDDIDWCRANLTIKESFYLIDNFNDELYELKLMSKCKHFIIANSTFSWWGAYLSVNENKTVIMPKNYLTSNMNGDIIEI